ncbi:hypothetical protein SCLCIDRAFT_1221921 [Scleroderma citrinum Foug A]|uniref:Uncharacterized protein n=1 Tax=Scleroderma citrinum Foug A TaxID=1036808 RepID=A0A0C2ZPK6_9AGAM|nr:hypothetical protein SCLCIDRAFT_1221921 [Scleroderma citrinum Foug A]
MGDRCRTADLQQTCILWRMEDTKTRDFPGGVDRNLRPSGIHHSGTNHPTQRQIIGSHWDMQWRMTGLYMALLLWSLGGRRCHEGLRLVNQETLALHRR